MCIKTKIKLHLLLYLFLYFLNKITKIYRYILIGIRVLLF